MWLTVLIANVACASVIVGRQKPQTSHGMPPARNIASASSSGGRKKKRSSNAISGTFEKSRIDRVGRLELVVLGVVEEPADVGVVEAADHRAVRIAVAIGELVMVDVMAGPPERPLLHRRGADERPDEPGDAVHLERAVREVAVEDQRQPDARGRNARPPTSATNAPAERHREDQQRRHLHQPEHADLARNLVARSKSLEARGRQESARRESRAAGRRPRPSARRTADRRRAAPG